MDSNTLAAFIDEHRLPKSYLKKAKKWFVPMVSQLVLDQEHAAYPLIIGINGAQGSGKTTLAALMVSLFAQHGLKAVSLSIDDFYCTRAERFQLADKVNPLLRSRGVPGTHDIALAVDVVIIEGWCIGALAQAGADLNKPVNALEREQDRTREWRTYANQ